MGNNNSRYDEFKAGAVKLVTEKNGIKSKRKAKWKATTNSKHNLPVGPNLAAYKALSVLASQIVRIPI